MSWSRHAALAALFLVAAAPAQEPADPADSAESSIQIERVELKAGVRVEDALRLMSEIAGLNLVATPDAAKVQVTGFVLQGVTAKEALEALCKTHQLWFRRDGSIIRVMTAEEYQKDLTIVREPVTRIYNLLHPNPLAVAGAIRDLFGPRVVLSFGLDEGDLSGALGFGSTIGAGGFGLNGNVGTPFGGSNSGAFGNTYGGGFNNIYGGGGFGGFGGGYGQGGYGQGGYGQGYGPNGRDAAERIDKEKATSEALARLTDKTTGKPSEAELYALTEGRPVIAVTVNRRHNFVVVRTSDSDALKEIDGLVVDLDRPLAQVLLEVKVLEVRLGDGFDSAFDVDWLEDPVRGNLPTGKPGNPFTGAPVALEHMAVAGNFPIAAGGALVYQYLNEHVRVRLNLLGRENRLATMATPLLMCANNEVARIFIGEERPLVRDFQQQTFTTDGVVTNQVIPTVELRDIGNTLRLVPRINADRSCTITVLQDVSTVNPGAATLPVPDGSGGVTSFPIDTVNTANLQGTIVAKDGMTIAIGGLIRKEKSDIQEGIPWFQELPFIGWIFGSTSRRDDLRELVLLVTPHVIMTPAESQARTRARVRALSIHPYLDMGDRALNHYDRDDVPGSEGYRLLIEDYLLPIPMPASEDGR